MTPITAYDSDLAYIHDTGFGDFANQSAPGLLNLLADRQISSGHIVDLGCGSGIWARQVVDSGYRVTGVDVSAAMIEIARRRVPQAEFHVASLFDFRLPLCRAITALGEVFNYLFDESNSPEALRRVFRGAFDALSPGGLLILDVAEPGRCRGQSQSFRETADWACLVEYQHDFTNERLTRRIVTFRRVDDTYRRREETHCQQLYRGIAIAELLAGIGFRVQTVRSYGEYALPENTVGLIAKKPTSDDSHENRFDAD